jgi:hypothetical protein
VGIAVGVSVGGKGVNVVVGLGVTVGGAGVSVGGADVAVGPALPQPATRIETMKIVVIVM